MQFVPSFLMTTFFIQSCASLSCKMESHSVMYADGKQKEGQITILYFAGKVEFYTLPEENTQKYTSKYCLELQQKDYENIYPMIMLK